jgi:tetratricopeptide (TPR) repeat protein
LPDPVGPTIATNEEIRGSNTLWLSDDNLLQIWSYTKGFKPFSNVPTKFKSGRMPQSYLKTPSRSPVYTLFIAAALAMAPSMRAQSPGGRTEASKLPPVSSQASSPKALAYYHFSLGHMYEDMAAAYNNRIDYVNKAIENFRLAIKEDPSTSFLVEDIAELYRSSGRIREAVEEAQDALKANPNDLNARRVLARIYTGQIGDTQANRVDEGMARRAVEQYKAITDQDPKDVDSLVMLGRLDRVLNSSVDAEAAFKKALAVDPENEDAMTGLASVYSDRGDAKEASAILEKLAQSNPSPRALVSLATNYEQMKEYALAADAYKKALAIDPSRLELKSQMAQDLALSQQYDEALKAYRELADANAQDPEPLARMAQICEEQHKLADARGYMDKALAVDRDNMEIRYYDSHLLIDEGKLSDATKELKDILDSTAKKSYDVGQRSSRARMLEELGVLFRRNDQTDQAVATFREVATLDPDSANRQEAQIVDTYRQAKDYTKAIQESDAALKKSPDSPEVRAVRAQVYSDQNKPDLAIAELKKMLSGKNDKNDREVYLQMVDVYQKARDFPHMAEVLDSAAKLATEKEDKNSIVFLRGAMYERQKRFDMAEKEFRKVLDEDPKNASAWNYLGYMLADQNIRLGEAQNYIEKALTIDPDNYAYLDSLGWVYFRQNKLTDAETQLSHSLRLYPKDPTIHDHLGDVLFKQGKLREAIAQWQSSLKEWDSGAPADIEPDDLAKVQKKLDGARVKLAQEQQPGRAN